MLSATTVPLQGAGLSEFSGLRSSASLPLRRSNAASDDFMNAVSFRTHAVRALAPSFGNVSA
jgi:glyceraldehyde-3-phosphate dehydrogenase (NADP+) (phosphorylating)